MYNAPGIHGLATEASGGRWMLDGTYLPEDGYLLLASFDTRLRLRWTAELHERFVDAVTQLGVPEKATPKTILRTMGVKGLTLYHMDNNVAQMEVQQRLHEHLEVQHHLQIRIEAQSKYLQSILEKACNALDDQSAEAAREEELSQLEVEVANNCDCVLAIPSENI